MGNHSLLDGNKRLGWVATRLFYDLNESPLRVESADAVVELVMSIADGSLTDVAVVARRLRDWRRRP